MTRNSREILLVACLIIAAIVAGIGIVWFAHELLKDPAIEGPAPAVLQADGSVVVERAPDPKARPPHALPRGAKVERVVSVTVEPSGKGITLPSGEVKCPPVTVDLSLDRMPDGTRRVVASSPDGQITKALDIPVESIAPPAAHKWAAGLSYDPVKGTPGVWLERDLWRVRLGVEANQTRQYVGGPTAGELRLRVGVTW